MFAPVKRAAKSRYKYEVRRLRRRDQYIRREKMAAALALHNSNSFWHQVRCVNKSQRTSPGPSVDGVSGAQSISQLFSAKLHGILNSHYKVLHLFPLMILLCLPSL